MIKSLFFDIDGTLLSYQSHKIPLSTIDGVRLAKEKGVKVFISTGRPFPLICNIDDFLPFVDGFVTTNGAYNFIGDSVINCDFISPDLVLPILDDVDRLGVPCLVVAKNRFALVNGNDNFFHIFHDLLRISSLNEFSPLADVVSEGVLQLTPFFTQSQVHSLDCLSACTVGRWHPDFIDVTAAGIDKGVGLCRVADFLGLDLSETMAFGDGGNDIPIIKTAGIGVAMGNGGEDIKLAADHVTSSVDDDGIFNALRFHGVI